MFGEGKYFFVGVEKRRRENIRKREIFFCKGKGVNYSGKGKIDAVWVEGTGIKGSTRGPLGPKNSVSNNCVLFRKKIFLPAFAKIYLVSIVSESQIYCLLFVCLRICVVIKC